MKLSDLKTGMIVTLRNGMELVVFRGAVCDIICEHDVICNASNKSWFQLISFGEDLKHIGHVVDPNPMYDIVKVEKPSHVYCFMDIGYERNKREVLWEEKEKIMEVTMGDIEKKFGCKVKIVKEKGNE